MQRHIHDLNAGLGAVAVEVAAADLIDIHRRAVRHCQVAWVRPRWSAEHIALTRCSATVDEGTPFNRQVVCITVFGATHRINGVGVAGKVEGDIFECHGIAR